MNSIIKVRRVDYKVDNMKGYAQWSLERACVQECDPFCVSMGGRTKVTYLTHNKHNWSLMFVYSPGDLLHLLLPLGRVHEGRGGDLGVRA